jgi:hypothetical protein
MIKLTKYKDGTAIYLSLSKTKSFALTPIEGVESKLSFSDFMGHGTTIWDIDNNRVIFQVRERVEDVGNALINGWV